MNFSVSTESSLNTTNLPTAHAVRSETVPVEVEVSVHDTAFQLGLWLSGLQSFLQIRNYSLADGNRVKASVRDWTKEFELTNSTLLLCSKLS